MIFSDLNDDEVEFEIQEEEQNLVNKFIRLFEATI